MLLTTTRQSRPYRGQSLVEAAFVLPILMLLLTAIVDYGRIIHVHVVLQAAVRDGVRVGTADPFKSDAAIVSAIQATSAPWGIVPTISLSDAQRDTSHGKPLTITAQYDLPLVSPGIALILQPQLQAGKLRLSESATMVIQ
jgi:Flp pilus assembly protein TadG